MNWRCWFVHDWTEWQPMVTRIARNILSRRLFTERPVWRECKRCGKRQEDAYEVHW